MTEFDLVVRGASVADGTGAELRTADVAIGDGVVAAVGRVEGHGRREIQADGALVAPGWARPRAWST
jgi:N-acyl-D-aspartate/D-glutamate deacylase